MHQKNSTGVIASIFAAGTLSASAAWAATTPYDLIRPTWPLSWDATVFEKFDTTITKRTGMLPKETTPASFKAGELMPDTLDQAYLDAINTKISPIRVNQAGYLESDPEKQFYYVGTATDFEVVDAYGKSLSTKVTGTFTSTGVETTSDWTIIAGTDAAAKDHRRYQVDFTGQTGVIQIGHIPESAPTNERLRIKIGNDISSTFIISDNVYTMAKDAALKFFGVQRSGNSQSWFHGPSHVKDGAGKIVSVKETVTSITSKAGALQGGWYDCGDHLKESQTQAFAFMALAVMSTTNPTKDVDHYAYNHAEFVKTDNIPDVLREAKHGADFFLRAYNFADGIIDNMAVSVGNFGADHGWWGRPEVQDALPTSSTGRGGSHERDIRLGELGSNIAGEIVAGLAILSKDYAKYDKNFADSCLMVAEKMYDFAKNLKLKEKKLGPGTYDGGKPYKYNTIADSWGTAAYNGNNESYDDLAIAAIALHYATYEKTGKMDYLNDAVEDKEIGVTQEPGVGFFHGGWMASDRDGMRKSSKNTNWANAHTYTLYGFYKMLLKDTETSLKYGIDDKSRLAYAENIALILGTNISYLSGSGSHSIIIPTTSSTLSSGARTSVSFGDIWYSMQTDNTWIYNHYQMGNIFEVLAYSDVTKDLEGVKLPQTGVMNWNAEAMKQLGINQLNYMFGMNPWDISFVYGVGDKNDAHPHHRASNPEGRTSMVFEYKYVTPVGAVYGGTFPGEENSINSDIMSWENYQRSETSLNASTLLLSALTILSNGGNDYYEKKCDNCKTSDATPFSEKGAYASAYLYEFGGLDFLSLNITNTSMNSLDSVVAYIYFEASKEDVESCGVIFDEDLCQYNDMTGLNKSCDDDFDMQIRNNLRMNNYEKIEGTYNKEKKTYTWVKSITIPTIEMGTPLRLDIGISSGISTDNGKTCETLRTPSKIKLANGWSFRAHKADKNAPAYEGAPTWNKDQGDIQEAPKDPYIVIRSKGNLLWGYGPSNTTDDRVGTAQIAQKPSVQMQLSRNTLFVQANAQGSKTVKIFDVLGNQLLTQTFNGTSAEVNLANIPHRGALIARVMSGSKLLATQSIKIK